MDRWVICVTTSLPGTPGVLLLEKRITTSLPGTPGVLLLEKRRRVSGWAVRSPMSWLNAKPVPSSKMKRGVCKISDGRVRDGFNPSLHVSGGRSIYEAGACFRMGGSITPVLA